MSNLFFLMTFLLEDLHWICDYVSWINNYMGKVVVPGKILFSLSIPNKAQLMEEKCFHGSTGN